MNPGPATTTISLFGHFGYQQGERALTQFSYDKVKALLVYLLMQETPVSRAALAEMLWPDQGVKSGRTNLRHALHCLRHSLGDLAEVSLSVTRQTIAFDLPASVIWDLRAADDLLQQPPSVATLERLLDYYRGDLLAELHLGQCVAFQQWLVRTRGEWRQRLIEYAERVLETASALPEALLRTLIHRIPDYGPFHERLVRQLAEHGQFAAAREQFNAFLQHLALSGQQPEPGFLQLARFWSEVPGSAPGCDGRFWVDWEANFRVCRNRCEKRLPEALGPSSGASNSCSTISNGSPMNWSMRSPGQSPSLERVGPGDPTWPMKWTTRVSDIAWWSGSPRSPCPP